MTNCQVIQNSNRAEKDQETVPVFHSLSLPGPILLDTKSLKVTPEAHDKTHRIDVEPGDPIFRCGETSFSRRQKVGLHPIGFTSIHIIVDGMFVLGRSGSNNPTQPDLCLSAFEAQQRGISRLHAAFISNQGGIKIVDLNSTNGTLLNGVRIRPNQPRILRDCDEIQLGLLKIIVKLSKSRIGVNDEWESTKNFTAMFNGLHQEIDEAVKTKTGTFYPTQITPSLADSGDDSAF